MVRLARASLRKLRVVWASLTMTRRTDIFLAKANKKRYNPSWHDVLSPIMPAAHAVETFGL
jgi:hypothetical protein